MTTSVVGRHWRDRRHDEVLTPTRHPDWTPAGAMRIAQLQGVVMAVYGVSASAAVRELQWHSARLNTSVAELADDVMRSVSGQRTAMTSDVLGALLAGLSPPRPERGQDRRHRAPALASALHLVATDRPPPVPEPVERWTWERDGLSRRESQVLDLIGQGLSNQSIATTMFVTVNTVKSYIRAAYRKIGVSTRAQAVRWAVIHGERG